MTQFIKKKLLHIFYNFDAGGAQKRLVDFITYTNDIFEHHITALNGDYSYFSCISGIAKQYPIDYEKGKIFNNIKTIRKAIKQLKPDCVLTQNFGTFEAMIANTPQIVPHIHNEDGFGADEFNQLKWKRNLLRKIFLSFKTLIIPSQTLEKIASDYWRGLKTHIQFIPNGVLPFQSYDVCPFNSHGKFTIGTVAVCRPEKNLRAFVDLIATLKKHNLNIFGVLVGDGSELLSLKEQAKKLNLTDDDIHFAGYQENHRAFTAFFDIFALCSLTEQQPFGILDAMAARLPIISTHVGDIPNMVAESNYPYIDDFIFTKNFGKVINVIQNNTQRLKIGMDNFIKYQSYYQRDVSLKQRKQIILDIIARER